MTLSKRISINLPKSWNELSESQLRKMALLFYSGKSGTAFDYQVWKILNNLRWWQFRSLYKVLIVLKNVPLTEIKKSYDYIYSSVGRTKFPASVKNNAGVLHYPPMDNLANTIIDEFANADDLHIKFRQTRNLEYLQMLTAILYVPAPIKRPEFVKEILPHLSDSFSKVPVSQLLAIELAYFGCKTSIAKRFPKAFPKASTKQKSSKYGFGKVLLQMAGQKFGNHAETRKTNTYTFLEQFQQDIIDAKENKK